LSSEHGERTSKKNRGEKRRGTDSTFLKEADDLEERSSETVDRFTIAEVRMDCKAKIEKRKQKEIEQLDRNSKAARECTPWRRAPNLGASLRKTRRAGRNR
jgi:hypothetical protein